MKWNYRRKKMKKVQIFICDEETEVSDEDVEEAIRNREFEDSKNLTLNNKKYKNLNKGLSHF